MSLSNTVKTHILDPTVFNTSRCEWRIPDGYLSSALKVVDVGCYSPQSNGRTTGLFYPSILGCVGAIRRIALFSDSTLIDEVQELAAYASVQHLRTTNQGSEDLSRFELLNGISLSSAAKADVALVSGALTTEPNHKDYVQCYNYDTPGASASLVRQFHNNQVQITGLDANGASGVLVLSNYLEFLRSVPVLPSIPNLRLVIEWDTAVANFYNDQTAPAPPASPVFYPIRPQIMIDEILGVAPPQGLVKLPYNSMIVERFVVPSTSAGAVQQISFRSGAFRNRFLKDLVLFNKVQANETGSGKTWMLAKQRSVAQELEKIQLVVNSRKWLADNGIMNEAQKIQMFNDTFSGLNLPLAAAMSSTVDSTGTKYRMLEPKATGLTHNFSVTGISVGEVIDRLDLEYQRTGSTAQTLQTEQFELLAFGRVARLLELQNGQLRLSY